MSIIKFALAIFTVLGMLFSGLSILCLVAIVNIFIGSLMAFQVGVECYSALNSPVNYTSEQQASATFITHCEIKMVFSFL